MKNIKDFDGAIEFMMYLRSEEGYEIGWNLEKSEPVSSSFGEKWKNEVTDSDGNLKKDLLKGEWTEFDNGEAVYHETVSDKSVYAIVKQFDGKQAIISVVYK